MAWPLPWGRRFVFWTWAQWNPESMIRLFSDDPGVIAAGVPYFRACSYDYLMVAFVFCLNGYLNGRVQDPVDHGQLHLRGPLPAHPPGVVRGEPLRPGPGDAGHRGPVVSGIMAAYTCSMSFGKEEAACL